MYQIIFVHILSSIQDLFGNETQSASPVKFSMKFKLSITIYLTKFKKQNSLRQYL